MSIRFTRTSRIVSGKGGEAMAFAGQISAHLAEKLGVPVSWGTQIGGPVGVVYWYIDYDSMAHMEEVNQSMGADEDYRNLVAKAGGLFEDGGHDTFVALQ